MGKFLKTDAWVGLIWFCLGMAFCLGGIKLNLGNFHKPGAGFMPFSAGAFLGLLGLIQLLLAALKTDKGKDKIKGRFLEKVNWRKFLITFLTMVGYVMFFQSLGFLLATFLLLFLLLKLKEVRWIFPVLFSAAVAVLGYLLFVVWLKCPFPGGIPELWLKRLS